jgi:nicotinamidase-related amidase
MKPSERAALIVIDFQNDYCSPQGAYGQAGTDLSMMPPVIARAAEVIDAARRAGVMVVWLQQTTLRAGRSAAPSALRSRDRYLARERCVDGSYGHEIVAALTPGADEPMIKKLRSSGFVGTMLDQVLNANSVESCVLVGVATEGCVEATARSARDHGYRVIVLEDCVASTRMDLHTSSLVTMRGQVDVVRAEAVLGAWKSQVGGGHPAARSAPSAPEELTTPARTALLLIEQSGPAGPLADDLAGAAARSGAMVCRIRLGEAYALRTERPGEVFVVSIRDDAFEGSPLHAVLRDHRIRTVVLVGTDAHRAVESTARGAVHRNYHVLCIEDAIDAADRDIRDAALAIMRQRYDVMTGAGLLGLWRAAAATV